VNNAASHVASRAGSVFGFLVGFFQKSVSVSVFYIGFGFLNIAISVSVFGYRLGSGWK